MRKRGLLSVLPRYRMFSVSFIFALHSLCCVHRSLVSTSPFFLLDWLIIYIHMCLLSIYVVVTVSHPYKNAELRGDL